MMILRQAQDVPSTGSGYYITIHFTIEQGMMNVEEGESQSQC